MSAPPPPESPYAAIPAPLTSLIGRDREVADVCALLRQGSVRLITLTGPGGVGKTRLATEVARAVGADYRDGARIVHLASVREIDHVPTLMAQAVGVRKLDDGAFPEQVRAVSGGIEALLVIDNLEHLLPAAPVVVDLLTACPRLTVLATSRERLRVTGEWDVPVSPLACPDPEHLPLLAEVAESPAVRLFVDRAVAANRSFVLAEANAAAVVAICHRLDGLPLALELAAARGPHLPPAALLARLARRLPLLTGGARDMPARLRTMRDAIGWSYDLLSPTEQAVFRRLSVFVGGCTLDAAELVIGAVDEPESDTLDVICALVDASLLRQESATGNEPRYLMLETVREFGLVQLDRADESAQTRARHAGAMLALVEEADPHLRGPDQLDWLDRLDAELPNLREAMGWLVESDAFDRGLRLATALWTFWVVRDRVPEGRQWLATFLARTALDAPERSAGLVALSDLVEREGDYAGATSLAQEALACARARGDRHSEAAALRGLGNAAIGLAEAARYLCQDEERADGEFLRAQAHLLRSLEIAEALGDEWAAAKAQNWLGVLWIFGWPMSRHYLEASVERFRRIGDHRQLCNVLWILGSATQGHGDVAQGRVALLESMAIAQRLGYRWHCSLSLAALGVGAAKIGEFERAARTLGASTAMRAPTGEPLRPGVQVDFDLAVDAARAALGDARFAAAYARGASGTGDAVMAEELSGRVDPGVRLAETASTESGDGLTTRELDVLRLVVAGRSDRSIADELFISRRTASKHVAAILSKLGATTRTEAATRAVREGLA